MYGGILPCTALASKSPLSAFPFITSGLIGWWKFDEGSGTTAIDSSTGGHNGTLTNGPTYSTDVPTVAFFDPYSLSFDGSNDLVDTGANVGNFNLSGAFTVTAWIKPALDSANEMVVGNGIGVSTTQGWHIRVTTANKLRFLFFQNTGAVFLGMDSNVLSSGWRAVAGVWDTSAHHVYIDGSEQSTTPVSGGSVTDISSSSHVQIGAAPDLVTKFPFNGKIDDVRLYNRALSNTELSLIAAGNG